MKDKIDFVLRGGAVTRFHTMRTVHVQNVAEHSYGVAMLASMLTDSPSVNLIMAALQHDVAEHVTGDIPAPTKRVLNISEQVSAHEDVLMLRAGIDIPVLTEEEEKILKFADTADLLLFCATELMHGNVSMRLVVDNGLRYIEELQPFTDRMLSMHAYIMEKLDVV